MSYSKKKENNHDDKAGSSMEVPKMNTLIKDLTKLQQ
jgi:hypothetical protein